MWCHWSIVSVLGCCELLIKHSDFIFLTSSAWCRFTHILFRITNMKLNPCRNVSYNNLVGDIPTTNNFSRFSPDRWENLMVVFPLVFFLTSTTSLSFFFCELMNPSVCSFVGNPDLCGYWLNSPCHVNRPTERGKYDIN